MSVMAELQPTQAKDHEQRQNPYDSQTMLPYRELSRGAITSLALAVCSLLAVFFEALLPIPLIGLVVGLLAWRAIRRSPDEYTGRGIAVAGTVGCGLLLIGAT